MTDGNHDYIPGNDEAFNQFFRGITQYVAAKTSGPTPEWAHIPQSECINFHQAYTDWYRTYAINFQARSAKLSKEKEKIRRIAESSLQNYVKRFLRFEPVTNLDRENMGLPNHEIGFTPHREVSELVEFEIKLRKIHELTINFWCKDAPGKVKPRGYDGAVLAWGILDTPPERPEELLRRTLVSSRHFYRIIFDDNDRGKNVYIAMAWQNQRGHIGTWSEIKSAKIP